MTFKCLECGHIFEDGEQAIWEEHHPYGMGYAAESFVC
jgi:predicted  nucleic acid-binding Zn-ribbon protein